MGFDLNAKNQDEILTKLFENFYEGIEHEYLQQEVEDSRSKLRAILDKEDRKHVLRIIDGLQMQAELNCYDSFVAGFKLANSLNSFLFR